MATLKILYIFTVRFPEGVNCYKHVCLEKRLRIIDSLPNVQLVETMLRNSNILISFETFEINFTFIDVFCLFILVCQCTHDISIAHTTV